MSSIYNVSVCLFSRQTDAQHANSIHAAWKHVEIQGFAIMGGSLSTSGFQRLIDEQLITAKSASVFWAKDEHSRTPGAVWM